MGENGDHAFYYNGTMHDLGTLGGNFSTALGINADGLIVGSSYLAGDMDLHAFLYNGTGLLDLGTLGGAESYASAISSANIVVGRSETAGNALHAFVWFNGNMSDLNNQIVVGGSGWVLQSAEAINVSGEIVGYGTYNTGNGTQTRAFLLTPTDISPPIITKQPVAQAAKLGGKVSFSVTAVGAPGAHYVWSKNGKEISKPAGATLTLSNLTAADAGTYKVLVVNFFGSTLSTGAKLTIVKNAPSIKTQPKAVSAKAGANVTFKVVAGGDAPLTYQWQKNSVNLKNAGNVSGVTTATLSLAQITKANAGQYRVNVSNPAGKVTSLAVALTVK
jgi:probable HAF family extracellular repeat protein